MTKSYDTLIIGGGPGGYVAAIKAAQLGQKTACVEKRKTLGGTCLNVGCIPSKALLKSSHLFEMANNEFAEHGIDVGMPTLDLSAMMKRKDKVVADLTGGIAFLFKKNKVDHIEGTGKVVGTGLVEVNGEKIEAKNIIIATGSEVTPLPGIEINEDRIVSSTGALSLPQVPRELVVIGGGVIGLELGSVWARLGAKVTVVEFLDRILPEMDQDVSKNFKKILAKQGIDFKMSTKVTGAKASSRGVTLTVEPASGGEEEKLKADYALVCIGRRPFTDGLGLEEAGVQLTDRGRIQVDEKFQTNVPGIYAIGDVIDGPMLAHKAEEEGIALVEMLDGQKPHINYEAIPGIVYTEPEVAAVGQTEQALKAAGVDIKTGTFPFSANSRARAVGHGDGFVKLIADAKTDRLLGAHIIGPAAGDLIHELTTVIEFGGATEDIARSSHGHPTYSEAVKEAAFALLDKPIHM